MYRFSKKIQEKFLCTHCNCQEPFFSENGNLYLRYDEMRITGETKPNQTVVSFYFKGEQIANFDIDGRWSLPNETLNIHGLEGRVQIMLRFNDIEGHGKRED